MIEWIDIHTHLNMLDIPVEQAVDQAVKNGVTRMISIGTHPNDLLLVLGFVDRFQPYVFGTLGIHPEEASVYNDAIEAILLEGLDHPRIVAAGEMGLDYFHQTAPRDVQQRVFRRQMEIAESKGLPVEIHTRDAEEDTLMILKEFAGRVRGVLHCFTGSQWLADEALKIGYNISISGIVTFKNAESLRQVVKSLPLDRIHVETDAPFLSPVPHRGKKNVPAFVAHTAEFVAQLKGIAPEELARITHANAARMFPKLGQTV